MTKEDVLQSLENFGNPNTKKILAKHGAREPFFGVKVGDLKKLVKKIKKDHELSLELFDTGNSDAMYLAGLIADEDKITKAQLQTWIKKAYWYMLSEYTVPWITAESKYGWALAREWIESDEEMIANAGWSTLSNIISITPDEDIPVQDIEQYLRRVESEIQNAPNRVRYTMNGFVIAVGSYIESLTDTAMQVAESIGKVSVEMGGTSCKVPLATAYIKKVMDMGRIGKKRKMARC
jgi:3-methyladenine DNA glycosylase AlkD